MIVHNFNVVSVSAFPPEADSPLVIHSDAMLTFAVSFQRLQTIARRHEQLPNVCGGVQE